MNIFVLGIPHTKTTTEFTTCAYTMKVWNLCRMLHDRGHTVIHVGTEGSNPACTTHLSIVPAEMQERLYGHPGSGYFNMDATGKYQILHDIYAQECDRKIREYCNAHSIPDYHAIICATWGGTQIQGTNKLPQLVVESGIGYHHTFSKYRVFESYAWLHFHWGRENCHQGANWYDVVIPNAFDPAMFPYSPADKRKDYFLYIGRMNDDKGLPIAIDVTKRLGMKLLLVGPTDVNGPSRFLNGNPNVEYRPPVGVEERMKIMGEAKAAFVPSIYLEPFGGVNVELQMTGCPVITTDWGAFTETVLHGETGYRCRTLEQFIWAAKNIDKIRNEDCRAWAVNNYSLERIAPMYEEFFQMVLNLRGLGFYQEFPKRSQLMWMTKSYPAVATAQPAIPKEHVAPEIETAWQDAIKWEAQWWGETPNERWASEVEKQKTYARLMGLPHDLNMGIKNIMDIGCGPTSMLLRATHGDDSVGIDPLPISKAMKKRYKDHKIKFFNVKGEDLYENGNGTNALRGVEFDEVWMYNCLQHVENPVRVLLNMSTAAKMVRIFEWINMGVCSGHPNNLTEDMFNIFRTSTWIQHIWNTGVLRDFGGTVSNNYIAIHVEKK